MYCFLNTSGNLLLTETQNWFIFGVVLVKIAWCFRTLLWGYTRPGTTWANEMNLVQLMPQVQDKLLDLLTCSPVCYHCATAAPSFGQNDSIFKLFCLYSSEMEESNETVIFSLKRLCDFQPNMILNLKPLPQHLSVNVHVYQWNKINMHNNIETTNMQTRRKCNPPIYSFLIQ